ncbi:MAG: uncharacterized protein PWR17_1001 [Candidatus Methanomethylophilaceae archaeon]|nr:uncharacterized protein [Candidatus Methanomethylophilaceae archaeon]
MGPAMMRHTFRIAPSIGMMKERNIWRSGIRDWDDFLSANSVCSVPEYRKKECDLAISNAYELLDDGDAAGLGDLLPKSEKWRLFGEFRNGAAYLDIETDGLERDSLVTVVTIHKKKDTVTLIHGKDLDTGTISDALRDASMLVTFNGSCFDLPVLKKSFPTLDLEMPHFDLRFASRKVGYRGGLKNLEIEIGISRDNSIKGVDGFEAVRLWKRWERHRDTDSLEKLTEYNRADTVNLKQVADVVYPKLVREYAGYEW